MNRTLKEWLQTIPQPYQGECMTRTWPVKTHATYTTFEAAINHAAEQFGCRYFWDKVLFKYKRGDFNTKPEARVEMVMPDLSTTVIEIDSDFEAGYGCAPLNISRTDSDKFTEQYDTINHEAY